MIDNYTFVHESEDSKITHEVNTSYLPDLLEAFASFLRGCGFAIDGDLIVYNESDELDEMAKTEEYVETVEETEPSLPKRRWWANIYNDGHVIYGYSTRKAADDASACHRCECVLIEEVKE